MAELIDRDIIEAELTRTLARINGRVRREALHLLGDPPDLLKITGEFWDNASVELQAALRPALERAAIATAEALNEVLPLGVDWGIVNQAAADWASDYTFELVRGVNATSQQAMQRAISRYYERSQTIGELRESIARIFSPNRAQAIAVTEVTRAAARGELMVADDLRRQGIDMVAVWNTNEDELVCPICGPLAGVQAENGIFRARSGFFDSPPAHVNCRCWVSHELPEVE